MKPTLLRAILAVSLLINIGVLGAIVYRTVGNDRFPGLPRHLQLTERADAATRESYWPRQRHDNPHSSRQVDPRDFCGDS